MIRMVSMQNFMTTLLEKCNTTETLESVYYSLAEPQYNFGHATLIYNRTDSNKAMCMIYNKVPYYSEYNENDYDLKEIVVSFNLYNTLSPVFEKLSRHNCNSCRRIKIKEFKNDPIVILSDTSNIPEWVQSIKISPSHREIEITFKRALGISKPIEIKIYTISRRK